MLKICETCNDKQQENNPSSLNAYEAVKKKEQMEGGGTKEAEVGREEQEGGTFSFSACGRIYVNYYYEHA